MHSALLRTSKRNSGSTTVLALLTVTIVAFIGATVLFNSATRFQASTVVGGWQEALSAAEAGADIGVANCRGTAVSGASGYSTAFNSANGWSLVDPTNAQGNNVTYSSPLGYSYTLPATCNVPVMYQSGQCSSKLWATVTVDGPSGLVDSYGNQWFRVRSTGYAALSGFHRVSLDTPTDPNARHTNELRKLSLVMNRFTGQRLTTPQATRTVEVILQPATAFGAAIVANSSLKAVNSGFRVDSFDSRDPNKSTNGQYDPAKFQQNGNIYANFATPNISGDIYGNVNDVGGDLQSSPNIHGQINNNQGFSTPPVLAPSWSTIQSTPGNGQNFQTGPVSAPLNYVCSGSLSVNIQAPAVGQTGAVNIWFTDDFTGSVTVPVGVICKIWITGDMKTPNINNMNNNAADLQFYGINPPNGGEQKWETKDTTGYYGLLYAPAAQIKTGAGDIYGSIIGEDVNIKNNVHYDEAFGGVGTVIDYARASWVEDPR